MTFTVTFGVRGSVALFDFTFYPTCGLNAGSLHRTDLLSLCTSDERIDIIYVQNISLSQVGSATLRASFGANHECSQAHCIRRMPSYNTSTCSVTATITPEYLSIRYMFTVRDKKVPSGKHLLTVPNNPPPSPARRRRSAGQGPVQIAATTEGCRTCTKSRGHR